MKTINEFQGDYRFLSNFYHAPLRIIGIPYLNSEAAFQACKTLDTDVRATFSTVDPATAKKMGRKIELRPNWDDGITKVECMELCLWAKFSMNPELRKKLLATGDAKLIEGNNWGDTYWGVCKGKGQNILGKLLMEIRTNMRIMNQ